MRQRHFGTTQAETRKARSHPRLSWHAILLLPAIAWFSLLLNGCGPGRQQNLSSLFAPKAADFVITASTGKLPRPQRLYVGLGGNGVFLSPGGDASPEAWPLPTPPSPIVFGDFWDKQQRQAVLGLIFAPTPPDEALSWQGLNLDSGLATTYCRWRKFPFRQVERQVETVVTPEGICCWRIRSRGEKLQLRIWAPEIAPEAWQLTADTATARLSTEACQAVVRLRVTPPPQWHLEKSGRGQTGYYGPVGSPPRQLCLPYAGPGSSTARELHSSPGFCPGSLCYF